MIEKRFLHFDEQLSYHIWFDDDKVFCEWEDSRSWYKNGQFLEIIVTSETTLPVICLPVI